MSVISALPFVLFLRAAEGGYVNPALQDGCIYCAPVTSPQPRLLSEYATQVNSLSAQPRLAVGVVRERAEGGGGEQPRVVPRILRCFWRL